MKIPTRPLLVMHSDEHFLARIRAVAGKDYTFQELPDWPTMIETVREAPATALVVVDPFSDPGPRGISAGLNELMLQFPSIPILAALVVNAGRSEDLVRLGTQGIVEIIAIGHDDTPEALRRRFRNAQGRPLKALLEQVLPEQLPGRGRAILDAAAHTVSAGGHARDLAASLRLSRRTLLRWTDRSALPAPRRLLAWMRILLAAALLDDPGRTVYSVARACGYSSDSGLRRVTMKFVSASPTEMRKRGAFAAASKGFIRAMEKKAAMGAERPTTEVAGAMSPPRINEQPTVLRS